MNWSLFFNIGIVFFGLIACAPFQGNQSGSVLGSKLYLQGKITQEEYMERIGAEPVESTESGEEPLNEFRFEKIISFSFSQLSAAVLEGLQELGGQFNYPQNCNYSLDQSYQLTQEDQYNCGELPFGNIKNRRQKEVLKLDVDASEGREEGFDYRIDGFQVDFLASRQQFESQGTLSTLNELGDQSIDITRMLFQSTFLKVEPQDGLLVLRICAFAPGVQIQGDTVKTNGRFERDQFGFIPLRANGEFTIQTGRISYDHAEICGAFSVEITSGDLDLDIQVIGFEKPQLVGLKIDGIKSEGDVDAKGLLGFINFFTRIFNFNIEKEIAKAVNNEIEKEARREFTQFTAQEIESGRWLERFISDQVLADRLVSDLDKAISKALKERGPATPVSLDQRIGELCTEGSQGVVEATRPQFIEACENSISVELQSFKEDPLSREWGCYDHFFNPLETEGEGRSNFWWAERCEVDNLVTVTVPQSMIPLFDCLLETSQNGLTSTAAEVCLPEIEFTDQQLNIEPQLREILSRRSELPDVLRGRF